MTEISDTMKQWHELTRTGRGNLAQIKAFHQQHAKEIVKELDILNGSPEGRAALHELNARESRAAEYFSMLNDHRQGQIPLEDVQAFYRRFEAAIAWEIQEGQDIVREHKEEA